jgi:Ras-related protein Rab-28
MCAAYQSFLDLEDWYNLVVGVVGASKLPYVALLANKADLAHLRAVRPDKHNAFALDNRMYR